MNDYLIFSDAGCDLSKEMQQKLQITCIPLEVKFDSQESSCSSDQMDTMELYAKLRAGDVAKTSAANADAFVRSFEPVLQEGKDILYIAFSSGLSGTYNSSLIAIDMLKEKYPDRTVVSVDTLAASMGQGLLVYKAARMKENGASLQEVAEWVQNNRLNLCHWFTVDDLMFLKRGGRVSATTAVLGSVLGIKPVLHVDDEGHLINMSKARGRKASLQAMVDMMKKTAYKNVEDDVFISHGDCLEDAQMLKEMVMKQLGFHNVTIGIIGPTIGSHSGPGTLALFFLGTKR